MTTTRFGVGGNGHSDPMGFNLRENRFTTEGWEGSYRMRLSPPHHRMLCKYMFTTSHCEVFW